MRTYLFSVQWRSVVPRTEQHLKEVNSLKASELSLIVCDKENQARELVISAVCVQSEVDPASVSSECPSTRPFFRCRFGPSLFTKLLMDDLVLHRRNNAWHK